MKLKHFFLLLFLVPVLLFGLREKECHKIYKKVAPEWKRYNELIEQCNKLGPNDIERTLQLLKEAAECCRKGISCCDTILNDIASKSKSKRKKSWRVCLKSECKKDKNDLNTAINAIVPTIQKIECNLAFDKANIACQRSIEKATLANTKDRACKRGLNNVDEVITALNEISKLYEEATSIAKESLSLIAPYPSQGKDQEILKQVIENYEVLAKNYKKEAADWPANVIAQKNALKKQVETLKEDTKLFTEKGLKHNCYELQKQATSILEQLIESSTKEEAESFKKEVVQLKEAISKFEKEADSCRLTDITPLLSAHEFAAREKERKELFFKSNVLLNPDLFLKNLKNSALPLVVPLDGQTGKKEGDFILYTEQFYRFLIQSESAVKELFIKVYEKGQVIHIEKIPLPFGNTLGWESYLKNGMLFTPETKLKSEFGLDLRLSFACDPINKFSMIIAQKAADTRYDFSISLTQETSLYECHFSMPPPWQLEALRKPALIKPYAPINQSLLSSISLVPQDSENQLSSLETIDFPVLDKLIEELKKDPLALAVYVQNEIALVDPYLHQENKIFYAPSIFRNPSITYLEKQGSPWEQCQLLVYLLRKAGYQALYALGDSCSLSKDFVEKMLFTKLPEDQKEAFLKYPWVIFFNGKEWISLFPWMKEMQIQEGHDLYSFMPEEYASASRWVLRYLKEDERVLKHIGPDGDDTAGILFVRFVEEELRKRGFSLNDVGIHRTQLKKQFSSWKDFPHPSIPDRPQIISSLNGISGLFAMIKIEICSRQNPQKSISRTLPITNLSYGSSSIYFSPHEKNHLLHLQIAGENILPELELDESDQLVDIKIHFEFALGEEVRRMEHFFSIAKGTTTALCSHFGGAGPKMTSQFYDQFTLEKDEKKRLLALLSFVGASYFEKCSHMEKILANLHKVNSTAIFSFGLSKLSPDVSKTTFNDEDLVRPQVDMCWFSAKSDPPSHPTVWHQELNTAQMQYSTLDIVNSSSNEHQILREVFKDQYAISTVKLLQLAHQQQQKKGDGEGFLSFTTTSFEAADKTPEAAQSLYFPHLKDLNLRNLKATCLKQWDLLKDIFDPNNPLSSWSYAYMTPGLTFSQNGSNKEIGTLILSPNKQYALTSNSNLIFQGGTGSPLPYSYFTPDEINKWKLTPIGNSYTNNYTLQLPPNLIPPTMTYFQPPIFQEQTGTTKWQSDVRPLYKNAWNQVSDPVDTVTGAFYIDETDLALPGPFSLAIRRNYNSQNPLIGDLGYSWKLSLNPFLIEQDGKRFVAELDGTVIAYRYNHETSCWEVLPEDNPDLSNFTQKGIGSTANPFHAYIKDDVLYGTDGSKRFFKDGLLNKWVNTKGNILIFSYDNKRLSRIESSNGDFCGFHYNHEGTISEIYAKDGRRISYNYSSQGDLIRVTLPNTAVITYEYDRAHRIIRETKPHGRVLENIYDDQGRVKEQRSPMGNQQEMITTATFDYTDGITTVTDANGGKTIYKIFKKHIYKIIDPLGFTTLQSWFIDKDSWFDPETEQIVEWKQKGGAPRSLKSVTDKRGLTTYYLYDSRGNPEVIGMKGNDLTGNGEQIITKKLTYNDLNLCTQEETCGQKIITTYDSTFPYLPKRIEKFIGSTLHSYIERKYNSLGEVEREDNSGALTLFEYDNRGMPCRKTQVTGTNDRDVITTYAYNPQGQCIEMISIDGRQKNDFDIMGNQIIAKVFSPSLNLLSATYIGYDLNSAPIFKQTANSKNIIYFDYHASGLIKATRQSLFPSSSIAYTLYEYDPRGYLIEETDPKGFCTYRDYDAFGKVKSETKEGHTTLFSYEPGGLVETITSPSGAQVVRHYTTNGLLKEEIYPDGTKNSIVYDFFGRPILETKNDIAWEIKYDDANHRVIKTHLKTNLSEISEFDAHGNLIRFTDSAGFTSEKTYDNLNRIKTETSPSGKQKLWSYKENMAICKLPSGETTTTYYEGGQATKSETIDLNGALIMSSSSYFDAENDREELIQGQETTIIWKNALGLPIKVEKGDITTTHEYDACGNCIVSIDGDGRTTRLEFDGLGRLIQKELPDSSTIKFKYDFDSNLIEYQLPSGNIWKASYDSMRRKRSEELQGEKGTSSHWAYTYENGYLKETTDPMNRIHTYLYDLHGRVAQDIVQGGRRVYTYDPRGLLTTAKQIRDDNSWLSSWVYGSNSESSLVERSYDSDGNLSLESIYLNSNLIQQTHQKWTSSTRSLQIGNHQRNFVYRNNRLVQVSTQNVSLSYTYDLSGSLKSKNNQLTTTTIDYNASGLPKSVLTQLPGSSYQESLEWYPSGKLHTYLSPGKQQQFTYNARGYLISTGPEKYDFDFGSTGTGVRTAAPNWYVPQDGLDDFGKVLTSIVDKTSLVTDYNPMGQVISHNQKQFEWDPWGNLLKVTDPSFTYEASYDALGRRLQTRYTKEGSPTLTTTSLYDPEEEFQEIGIQFEGKTFWKIYGPNSCDALIDESGAFVILMHSSLDQLAGVVSSQGTIYSEQFPSAYGPQGEAAVPSDLISYAQSLNWHSKAKDPTGLIWMGKRYYDPESGRFLSPDPVSYPNCLDLYVYATGDPINYIDPDGRFASYAYQTITPITIAGLAQFSLMANIWNNTAASYANNGSTPSRPFQVGSFDLPTGEVGFINGIDNKLGDSLRSAGQVSQHAEGAKIYGIYNHTNGPWIDIPECIVGQIGFHTPPVQLLNNQWDEFKATHGPDEKFLQICHSGGAVHVKNALLIAPKSTRQRIIVLAIAPSVIIPNELCFHSDNYISRRDFVTYLDPEGLLLHGNQLHILKPHPNASFWDHEFLSPTFEDVLNDHIKEYIKKYGGKK